MPRHLRVIVILLFANLAVSAVFAALTVAFSDAVVAHQLAAGASQTREELAVSLWIRAGLVLAVAAGYLWVARRLARGSRGAYLRVRTIAGLGLVAVGYLLVSGAYPGWLRGVQVVQLVLLAALVVATNRRVVRESFPRTGRRSRAGLGAALVLVVVTPLVAEVMLGNPPLRMAWVIVIYVPIYGAGALLVRELVRRAGGGWAGLLLMGLAYGLLEEGLALQSLTSPTLYGAAAWAPRLGGVNTAYTELNLPYHAIFSVLVPITVVELLFPRLGARPYLRTPGVVAAGVVTLLGAGLLRLSVPPVEDPGYLLPLLAAAGIVALIAVLVVLALVVAPRRAGRPTAPPPLGPVSPWLTALACGGVAFAFLALLFPFGGASRPAFTHGLWVLAPMAAAAALAVAAGVVVARWVAAPGWTDRHRVAAVAGALVAHTAFGATAHAATVADRWFLVALALATTAAAAYAGHIRSAPPNSPAATATATPSSPAR